MLALWTLLSGMLCCNKIRLHQWLIHWLIEAEWCSYVPVKLTINGSDNGVAHGRRQAIIKSNVGIFLIGRLGTNFNKSKLKHFQSRKCTCKCRLRNGVNFVSASIVNRLRWRQVGCYFADNIFDFFISIFLFDNCCILIHDAMKLVLKRPINNKATFVSDNGLAPDRRLTIITNSLWTHICVTRPKWVNLEPWVPVVITVGVIYPSRFPWQ